MRTSRSLSIVFCLAFCTAFALRAEEEREDDVLEEDALPPEAVFLPPDVLFPDEELLLPAAEPAAEVFFLFLAPDADEVPALTRDDPLFVFCAIDILCVCPSQDVLVCRTVTGPVSRSCSIMYQTILLIDQTISSCFRLSYHLPDCLILCQTISSYVKIIVLGDFDVKMILPPRNIPVICQIKLHPDMRTAFGDREGIFQKAAILRIVISCRGAGGIIFISRIHH
jgi:hypothetical protein